MKPAGQLLVAVGLVAGWMGANAAIEFMAARPIVGMFTLTTIALGVVAAGIFHTARPR